MKVVRKILYYLLLLVITLIIVSSIYIRITQPTIDIPQLLFCLMYGLGYGDFSPVFDAISYCYPYVILLYLVLWILLVPNRIFKYNKKGIFKKIIDNRKTSTLIIIVISLLFGLHELWLGKYIYKSISYSNFIEDNYVDPKNVNINFEKKKNLIFIILESFESTVLESGSGGSWNYNLVPELSKLINDSNTITFSNSYGFIGMNMLQDASYTTASVFTNMAGITFKFSPLKRLTSNDFMKGSYTLGDLLYDNGYHNELITAATSKFGGIEELFKSHGSYEIIDINNISNYGYELNDNNLNPWGFNDEYLFNLAKNRLNKLSREDKPFNLTLLGIDTHFPNGFTYEYSDTLYDSNYENAYSTESKLVSNFINWVKEQDFYEDTTIVIIGDHESMGYSMFKDIDKDDRYIFACYINSYVDAININNRSYTALDTYPSILASIGANIDGNKLGLGVNIFSNEKTLSEKYGFDYLNSELYKNSRFYNEKIMIK